MKTTMKMILAAALVSGAGLFAAGSASAQPSSFSFRIGNVAIGYTDGYYDQSHRWHAWRNARERNWYRVNYRHYRGSAYRSMRRDADRDGIPNRFDTDRDNDGVRNAYDRAPNNPYRR